MRALHFAIGVALATAVVSRSGQAADPTTTLIDFETLPNGQPPHVFDTLDVQYGSRGVDFFATFSDQDSTFGRLRAHSGAFYVSSKTDEFVDGLMEIRFA